MISNSHLKKDLGADIVFQTILREKLLDHRDVESAKNILHVTGCLKLSIRDWVFRMASLSYILHTDYSLLKLMHRRMKLTS